MARTHNAQRRSQARSRGVLFLLSNASAAFAAAADAVAIEVSSVDSLFVQCSADSIAPNNSDNIEPTVPHEAEARLQDGFRKTQKIQALDITNNDYSPAACNGISPSQSFSHIAWG